MASGRFSKQAVWTGPRQINSNNAFDNQIGGTLNTFPGGVTATGANQGFQTLPGDRVILSPSDALVWSNNNVGNLYTGTFRYVSMRNNSTATPERARAAFWDLNAAGGNNNVSSEASDAGSAADGGGGSSSSEYSRAPSRASRTSHRSRGGPRPQTRGRTG